MNDHPVGAPPRRKFLAVLLGLVGAALTGFFAWPVLRFLAPAESVQGAGKVQVAKSLVPVGEAHLFSFNGRPAVLLQKKPGEFIALTAVCTHLGCIVKWVQDDQELLCPCHGGRFSAEGVVLSGPPPSPLERYPVSLQDDQILIG
ncbi:MAG: ubiquinol-cytochrome c reductase iron-sulfur subunit [Desulfuromonadales bacterium]|nr:ubiquinol-cytochrome c reductase iron-sulfur subunit [Desulfuromonadales bacterium]